MSLRSILYTERRGSPIRCWPVLNTSLVCPRLEVHRNEHSAERCKFKHVRLEPGMHLFTKMTSPRQSTAAPPSRTCTRRKLYELGAKLCLELQALCPVRPRGACSLNSLHFRLQLYWYHCDTTNEYTPVTAKQNVMARLLSESLHVAAHAFTVLAIKIRCHQ